MTSSDTTRLRRDILIEAQRLAQEIDEIEDQLERYRAHDLPDFNVWFEAEFEAERARLAEGERDLADLVRRHNAVSALAKMHALSLERAYRLIREEENAFARGNPATRRRIREERAARETFLRDELEREVTNRLGESAPPAEAPDPARAKLAYRKLVKRLHPDVNADPSCANEARWQRRTWALLQQAYAREDFVTLEALYHVTLIRLMDFSELSVAEARATERWLARERDQVATEFARARESQAWGFASLRSRDALAKTVREAFRQDLAAVRSECDEIRGQHEYLDLLDRGRALGGRRRRGERKPKPVAPDQLSLFDR